MLKPLCKDDGTKGGRMRYVFLALLASGPAHGYQLKRRHDALFASGWGPINIGQIYVTLGRLERDGLVTHRTVQQAGRSDRKVYELTELGRKALDRTSTRLNPSHVNTS